MSAQITKNEKNQDAPTSVNSGEVGTKSANSKKSKLTKSKNSDLLKANFARVNSEMDFLTPKTKKAFIHLRKTFTKALILRHFDSECHIRIETDGLGYTISGILSQMTSDQHFSGHVICKDPNSDCPKSEIGQ